MPSSLIRIVSYEDLSYTSGPILRKRKDFLACGKGGECRAADCFWHSVPQHNQYVRPPDYMTFARPRLVLQRIEVSESNRKPALAHLEVDLPSRPDRSRAKCAWRRSEHDTLNLRIEGIELGIAGRQLLLTGAH
jgi:hypothetical protein